MDQFPKEERKTMLPFKKCPTCGGELQNKVVEKILYGGSHTAILEVKPDVCLHCGERLYSEEVVRLFENIRNKLKRQDLTGFHPSGQTFTVDKEWLNKQMKQTADHIS
jgi:YgiT-type zinc finger domain-containing protein